MPFDSTTPVRLEPTLENLAFALRHKEMWPEKFEWDYGTCSQCAMGLVSQLWLYGQGAHAGAMERLFAIREDDARAIFINLGVAHNKMMKAITPTDVADAIDRYLAKQRP